MKCLKMVMLTGFLAWVSTTRWDDIELASADRAATQVSSTTQAAPDAEGRRLTSETSEKPKFRDILLGPRAPSWRDVRADNVSSALARSGGPQ
jgi:hypothetical protein